MPGTRPDRFAKAQASGADGIVLDLGDAVSQEAKTEAREYVRRWRANDGEELVRINDATTDWHEQDLAALGHRPCAVGLPKTTNPGQVMGLLGRLPAGSCVVPILETAAGVPDARSICEVPGVVRVAFGNGDLASQLGIDHRDWAALAHARSAIVLASAACGIAPPLDGVTTAVNDDQALTADTRQVAGCAWIHRQDVPTNSGSAPETPIHVVAGRPTLCTAAASSGDHTGRPFSNEIVSLNKLTISLQRKNSRS